MQRIILVNLANHSCYKCIHVKTHLARELAQTTMLARIGQAATRAAPSSSIPALSWSVSVRNLSTSVFEARHRIFGDSPNRDPSPFKALANLQAAGGFKGPKARGHAGLVDA
jgi:hypothetical protein